MKPYTNIFSAPLNISETYWLQDGPPDPTKGGAASWTVYSDSSSPEKCSDIRSLSCGDVVKGNFHDPNAWNYGFSNVESVKGSSVCTLYPNSARPTTISRDGPWFGATEGPFNSLIVPSFNANTYNSALSRLNEKVRGTLDLSIDLIQSRQTFKMFGLIGKAERLAMYEWDKYKKSRNRRITKDVADAWLEVTYGWKPLLSSIYGVADQLLNKTMSSASVVKTSFRDLASPISRKASFSIGDYQCSVPSVFNQTSEYRCQIGMSFLTREGGPSSSKWTSLNPISIGYELMPYSFVLDWFYDVGSYLRNAETALAFRNDFQGGYVSEMVITKADFVAAGAGWRPDRSATYSASLKGKFEEVVFRRQLLQSYPFPRTPSFKADLGSSRLLSAAALLRGFIK